jgi:hypothetical protein
MSMGMGMGYARGNLSGYSFVFCLCKRFYFSHILLFLYILYCPLCGRDGVLLSRNTTFTLLHLSTLIARDDFPTVNSIRQWNNKPDTV